MATNRHGRLLAAVLLLAGGLLTAGCAGPSYYAQAVAGHIGLMRQREDIGQLLSDPGTDTELSRRLRVAQDIVTFGTETLGLPSNGSYTRLVRTGRTAVTWNVVAAPEFSLAPKTWCFLVAGCVPYRGYFDPEDAERFAARLRGQGHDVIVAPATAYSTLGWFDDPLLDTMFLAGDARLAGVVYHEMAHQALYVKGDTRFNESFASFVEHVAVLQWLASRGAEEQQLAWKQDRAREEQMTTWFSQARSALQRVYGSGRPVAEMRLEKARILGQLCEKIDDGSRSSGKTAAASTAPCRYNNASLALHASYQGGFCAFERLFDDSDRLLPAFLERAQEVSGLPPETRTAWLDRGCATVAPEAKL